jgi:hypothetical protein
MRPYRAVCDTKGCISRPSFEIFDSKGNVLSRHCTKHAGAELLREEKAEEKGPAAAGTATEPEAR